MRAFAETPVRAPQGMRVPVEKIHREQGDWVEKGDPLISFHREAIVKAIDEACFEGRTADLERFESYLASDPLRAPTSGRVGTIWAELGSVPYDEGIPMVTLIADDGFALDVAVPKDVVVRHVPLGLEVEARIESIAELVHGVVSGHDATGPDQPAEFVEGDSTRVTVALDSVDGVEVDMIGTVRLPHGTKEVPLLPKAAVEWRGDVPVVRAFEDGEILERTVRIARDERGWRVEGEFYAIEYGVFVGQGVVVPASQ